MLQAALVGVFLLAEVAEPELPIVGGELTTVGEFDGVVAVVAAGNRGLCTGTVVAESLVLTAAHCLAQVRDSSELQIRFGTDLHRPAAIADAVGFGFHPDFCSECAVGTPRDDVYDYGYIILDGSFANESDIILPVVTQAEWDATMAVGDTVTLVGYGEDPLARSTTGGIGNKRKVDTAISERSDDGLEFSAGGDDRDSCLGDSGGPALVQLADGSWRLAGITSRGSSPCGDGGFYGVPYAALSWVAQETGVNLCGSECSSCDCVDISAPPEDGCGQCRADDPRGSGVWALLFLTGLWGLRRRRPRPARPPQPAQPPLPPPQPPQPPQP